MASATYNAANQQTAFSGQTLTYDLNGNLTGDGTNIYTWNARDQLASISGPAPASFVYDPVGRRQRKTINGTVTDFVYDGLNLVKEAVGATTVDLLTALGIDEYLTRTTGGATEYLVSEALGSTVALADGAVATEYSYAPFGTSSVTGATTSNELGFTGREADETGVYYYRARYYHHRLQRFISEDPIGFGGGVNFYAYATNNPLRYVDPLGLFTVSLCVKGSASSGVSVGGGTCANFGYDRKEGMSFSITGTAGIGGGGVGATVGFSGAWSNAPTVLELNGPFAYGGVSGGPPGYVGGLYGFAGQGSRGTIGGAELYGGWGVKLPNTIAPPVSVEGG